MHPTCVIGAIGLTSRRHFKKKLLLEITSGRIMHALIMAALFRKEGVAISLQTAMLQPIMHTSLYTLTRILILSYAQDIVL